MTNVDLTKTSFSNNRSGLRKQIINIFLDEKPGTGKKHLTSRYRYLTKLLSDGREVFLNRPANFNNGFDFILNVSNTNFNSLILNKRASKRPTHDNILADLKAKKKENLILYNQLIKQINIIYSCGNPSSQNLNFVSGHPTDLLFECIKWLFVEQDVTYWNHSGRAMFFNAINSI